MYRRAEPSRPFTLRKAIELTEQVAEMTERMPEHERAVLGGEMSRYAFLLVGRLSKAHEATTQSRRYRSFSAARGAVAALSSMLEMSVRVHALEAGDVERAAITCDELLHMLGDLAGTPGW